MGFCFSNCPTHKEQVYLFPHTHTPKKKVIKIKNPKKHIEKTKKKIKKKRMRKKNKNQI
jgi:hypothetical protein